MQRIRQYLDREQSLICDCCRRRWRNAGSKARHLSWRTIKQRLRAAAVVEFNLAGQAVPQAFAVTAVNVVGESADSLKYKVTPPDMPKNLRLP